MLQQARPQGHTSRCRCVQSILDLFAEQDGTPLASLAVGAKVEATVHLIHQEAAYLVAVLKTRPARVAFLPTGDYNLQRGAHRRTFKVGQVVAATVAHAPSAGGGGRLLLHAPLTAPGQAVAHAPRDVALTVRTGRVTHIHVAHADVLCDQQKGSVHATHVLDLDLDDVDEDEVRVWSAAARSRRKARVPACCQTQCCPDPAFSRVEQ